VLSKMVIVLWDELYNTRIRTVAEGFFFCRKLPPKYHKAGKMKRRNGKNIDLK
jgi:hypothetical protein